MVGLHAREGSVPLKRDLREMFLIRTSVYGGKKPDRTTWAVPTQTVGLENFCNLIRVLNIQENNNIITLVYL